MFHIPKIKNWSRIEKNSFNTVWTHDDRNVNVQVSELPPESRKNWILEVRGMSPNSGEKGKYMKRSKAEEKAVKWMKKYPDA